MNAIEFFDRGHSFDPNAVCLIDSASGASLSYEQVRCKTLIVANALCRRGYGKAHKTAVWGSNQASTVAVILSVIRAGICWIPVNTRVTPQQSAATLNAFDCDLVFLHLDYAHAADTIRAQVPNLREIILYGDEEDAGDLAQWSVPASTEPLEFPQDSERLYSLIPSTGTSGTPKGIMTPVRAIETMTANILAAAPSEKPPIFLAVSPISHASGGFMHYVFVQGGTMVLFSGGGAAAIVAAFGRFNITHSFVAPTVIYDLLSLPEAETLECSGVRCIFYGGAPSAPGKIREAIRRFGPIFAQSYGQVEVGGSAAMLTPQDHMSADGQSIADDHRLSSCGRPLPFTRVEIMAEDGSGRLLPQGEQGEIVFRGQGVMLGYYGDPQLTSEIGTHGWHHSQDVGFKDDEGFIHVRDRKRDMIISGGFNIYSVEVENAALAHPAVQECAAIGVPDPRWGEAVKLLVRVVPGATIEAHEIISFCKQQIGSVMAPKMVEFVDSLPRNSAGKVLKTLLRGP